MNTDEVRALLHEVWLRVHNERFEKCAVNSSYAGMQRAEQVIHEIAEEHGIGYLQLRQHVDPLPTKRHPRP